jgi:hypothetical protein
VESEYVKVDDLKTKGIESQVDPQFDERIIDDDEIIYIYKKKTHNLNKKRMK